jgi:hypothetical protein
MCKVDMDCRNLALIVMASWSHFFISRGDSVFDPGRVYNTSAEIGRIDISAPDSVREMSVHTDTELRLTAPPTLRSCPALSSPTNRITILDEPTACKRN